MWKRLVFLWLACAPATWAVAHDTWIETNTSIIRLHDAVYIDLKLGNHGNDHRDFKLASKIALDGATLDLYLPDDTICDLKPSLADLGHAKTEGYWSARFVPVETGLYLVAHTLDKPHGTTRSIKSAKSFFFVSEQLDQVQTPSRGFDRVLGHPLELVFESSPVASTGPGKEIRVRLLLRGQPLANERISFIPRGAVLRQGFDQQFERKTDAEGRAAFTPTAGNVYLIIAHHHAPEERGEGYDRTQYSAALTLLVPEVCLNERD